MMGHLPCWSLFFYFTFQYIATENFLAKINSDLHQWPVANSVIRFYFLFYLTYPNLLLLPTLLFSVFLIEL